MPDPIRFDDALYAILQGAAAVTALLGTGDNTRVYPDRAPDDAGASDYVVYQVISGALDQTHDSADSLTSQRWQLDCISHTSAAAAKVLAKTIIDALHGYKGTVGGVRVEYVNAFDGPSDFPEAGKAYRRIVEIEVMFAEP